MGKVLHVVAGALAAGPAGIVWAYRQNRQQSGGPGGSAADVTSPASCSKFTLVVTVEGVDRTKLPIKQPAIVVLQVGEDIQAASELDTTVAASQSFDKQSRRFRLPSNAPENLQIRVEEANRAPGEHILAKGYVHLPGALNGQSGSDQVTIPLVSPTKGSPLGNVLVSLSIEEDETPAGKGQTDRAAVAYTEGSDPYIAIPDESSKGS